MSLSWSERLTGGFKKTSERLSGNLAGLGGTTKLTPAQLDEIEDALIVSDLGPRAAARIRDKLEEHRFEGGADERAIREQVAVEIAEILRPVAKPLEVTAFPRPQVILVIGVNGSGKTTTIAKLGHLFQEDDYEVMLAAGDTFRAAAIGQLKVWGERLGVPVVAGAEGEAARFEAILKEYSAAKEVTRKRLYLETMERVFGKMNKVIIDETASGSQGVVPYLPLDQLRGRTAQTNQ